MSTASLKLLFNLLALGVALGLAFGLCLGHGQDDSVWRVLASGRLIATQGGFPQGDPFNFSLPLSAPFDKDGWLFALMSYGLHQFAGLKALGLLRSLMLFGAFVLTVATGFRRGARPFSSALFALWALAAIQPPVLYGGPLAGFFFFALALFLMEGDFWPAFFSRWLWLPLAMVAWVNMDSSALLLLPMALGWALAERGSAGAERPQFPGLAMVSTLSVLAASAFLHPALWRIALDALPGPMATPFEPGAFENARLGLALLGLSGLLLLASALLPQGREHAGRDLLLFFMLALSALAWRGSLPFACFFAAPMAAARADTVIDALPLILRQLRWGLKLGALAAAIFFLPGLLAQSARPESGRPKPLPRETLAFFKDELLSGNIFNENDWSGQFIWELAPSAKVFSDGKRGSAADYVRILGAGEGWEKALGRYQADFAWLKLNNPLAKAMARSSSWQPVDFDDASVLYASVAPEHAALIKTWAPRGLRPGDMDEPFESSRLPQVEADLEGRRLQRPNSGILHYYEARYWVEKGREPLARQWLEQGIKSDPSFAPDYQLLGELRLKAGDKKGAQTFFERAAALGGL